MYYRKKRRRWRNNPNGVLTETIKCGMMDTETQFGIFNLGTIHPTVRSRSREVSMSSHELLGEARRNS